MSNRKRNVQPFDRLPPHDLDAEMCVLASMMLNADVIGEIARRIGRDDFFQPDHQVIFEVLVKMHDQNSPIDAILLRDELGKRQVLDEVGGNAYIGEILNTVPSAAHGLHYANIVRKKSQWRQLLSVAEKMTQLGYAPGDDEPSASAQRFADSLSALSRLGTIDPLRTIGEIVDEQLKAMKAGESRHIATGLRDIDAFGGIPIGEFVIVGARPGIGKSLLGRQIAMNVAMRDVPVATISIEEGAPKVAANTLAAHAGVNNLRIYRNALSEAEWVRLQDAAVDIRHLPWHIATAAATLNEIVDAITTAKVKHGCEIAFVDHAHLIDGGVPGEERQAEIRRASRTLKRLAKRLNIPIVLLCQLNRASENESRPARLTDLRECGSLEEDGDIIWMLRRPDANHAVGIREGRESATERIHVDVIKHKHAGAQVIDLMFDGEHQRITDIAIDDPF